MSCTSPTMGKHVQRFGGLTCLNWISTFAKEFSLSSLRVSTLGQFRKFYTHNEFSNFHSTASEWTIDIKHRISLNSFLHLASNGQFFHRFWVFYTLLLSEMFFFCFLCFDIRALCFVSTFLNPTQTHDWTAISESVFLSYILHARFALFGERWSLKLLGRKKVERCNIR